MGVSGFVCFEHEERRKEVDMSAVNIKRSVCA